jgi:hypothetical protein
MEDIVVVGVVRDPSHVARTLQTVPGLRGVMACGPEVPGDVRGILDANDIEPWLAPHGESHGQMLQAATERARLHYNGAYALFLDCGERWHGEVPKQLGPATVGQVGVGPRTCRWAEPRIAKLDVFDRWEGDYMPTLRLRGEQVVATLDAWVEPTVLSAEQLQEEYIWLAGRDDQLARFWAGERAMALGWTIHSGQAHAYAVGGDWKECRYAALRRMAQRGDRKFRSTRFLIDAVETLPQRPEAYVDLAELLWERGQNEFAYGMACAAVEASRVEQHGFCVDLDARSRAADVLACTSSALKKHREAVHWASHAHQLDPGNPRLVRNLAVFAGIERDAAESARAATPEADPSSSP